MSTITEEHEKKLTVFRELQQQLPALKKELQTNKERLRDEENHLIEKRKCLSRLSRLKKELIKLFKKTPELKEWFTGEFEGEDDCQTDNQRKVFEVTQSIRTLQKEHDNHDANCKNISKLEQKIKYMTLKIAKIENREEEFDYLFNVMDILRKSETIKRAEREGMLSTLDEKNMTLPDEKRIQYEAQITQDLSVNFITREGRNIFKKKYEVTPYITMQQLKTMYCLLLNEICQMKDMVIQNIIKTHGKCYVVVENIQLLMTESKNLEETIRYYGIPMEKYNLNLFIDYPEEEEVEHRDKKQKVNDVARSRKALYEKYRKIINNEKDIVIHDREICSNCQYEGEMMTDEVEAVRSCPKCGFVVEEQMVGKGMQGVPYGTEVTNIKSKNDYKPIMHLNDILKQKQAIESTVVADEIIDAVEEQRVKHRCERKHMNHANVRMWLKKLSKIDKKKVFRFAKYYEHIPQIIVRLGGPVPIRYTAEQENAIRWWFNRILMPFEIFRPKEGKHKRKNLFSYAYILRQICFIIAYYDEDMSEFWVEEAETFPLLKDVQKLFVYDKIWSKMMDLLGEPFFATI